MGRAVNRVTKPALRGSLLGAVLRLWNPVMRPLLGSPLHWPLSRWFAVLAWRGRETGRRYSTPVSYVQEEAMVYITTGDKWWRNLTGGAPVTIRIAGQWHDAVATAVTDPVESRIEHERLFREHPWFRWLSGIPRDRRGNPDPAAIERALVAGRVLVRIEPTS
jgi:hypothetical protein